MILFTFDEIVHCYVREELRMWAVELGCGRKERMMVASFDLAAVCGLPGSRRAERASEPATDAVDMSSNERVRVRVRSFSSFSAFDHASI
jgi:hypothetical protein